MSRLPTPLIDMDARVPEAGRIRLGVKSGSAMKSLDTFRFTSPDRGVIQQLAALYGGTAKPWRDAKASPPDQFEVITETKEIPVYLPANALSVWYELWSGGGVQRRCDGEVCQVPRTTPGGWEMSETPCICMARQQMECRAHSRLNVILPGVSFRGVWRLETKGWNAAHELPGMVNVIETMTAAGQLVQANLHIQRRVQSTPAGKRNFVVPGLTLTHTAQEMIAGVADVRALPSAPSAPIAPVNQLGHGGPSPVAELTSSTDDIIDAEIVETELDRLFNRLWEIGQQHGVNGDRLASGVLTQVGIDRYTKAPTEEHFFRIRKAIEQLESGALRPIGFNPNGTVIWKRQ